MNDAWPTFFLVENIYISLDMYHLTLLKISFDKSPNSGSIQICFRMN